MTIYLNPTGMTKEDFLQKHGRKISQQNAGEYNLDDHRAVCVVCLVGTFTAAGILNGQRDFKDFTDPDDLRPKAFYVVNTADVNAAGGPSKPVTVS